MNFRKATSFPFFLVILILLFLQPMDDAIAQYWMATISGHVRTSTGNPIKDVQVGNATTDASGYYQTTLNAMFGVFVTPRKDGWTFTPEQRGYPSGGTYTDQDYAGTLDGGGSTSNIITFAEDRYKAIAGQRLYRGGMNTLIDAVFGLDFYVAYGDMMIMQTTGSDYALAFSPYTPSGEDPRGRIVITFNNLQEYVRIDVSTDGTPIHQPAYLRVSWYASTQPENPLHTKDGGGNIEYTNTDVGIKMLIVDTHYAENDIDELEFRALEGGSNPKPMPTGLIALSGYHHAIPIAWKAPATRTPEGYNVYRSTISGASYQKVASDIHKTYYRDDVFTEAEYYYVVTAVYSDGESDYSGERSVQVIPWGNTGASNWTSSTPTVDGVINTSEWQNAAATTISYPGDGSDVTMYAMNDGSYMYLAVDNPRDVSLNNGDNFSLFIDSEWDREWPAQGSGHDGMLRFTWNDGPTVWYRSMYGTWPDELTASEWLNPTETEQAMSTSSGHVQYEAKIPLNSYIIYATLGDEIGLCCFVWDNGSSSFNALKPYETEYLSPLTSGYFWSYGPFAYMDFSIAKQEEPKQVIVRFQVDMTGEMSNLAVGDYIGIRGSHNPLEWSKTLAMSDDDGDNVYIIDIDFTGTPAGTKIEYKFVHHAPPLDIMYSSVVWEPSPGPTGPNYNRELVLTGSSQVVPVVYWNNINPSYVSYEGDHLLSDKFQLMPIYPNPFNSETIIRYQLPKMVHVMLTIVNIRGEFIRTLVDWQEYAGIHSVRWDGLSECGESLSSGLYLCRMVSGDYVGVQKIMLIQ